MKHIRKHKSYITRVLAAVIISSVAIPAAMTGLFPRMISADDAPAIQIRDTAYNDAGRVRFMRRNYWKAVDTYNELTRFGYENLLPPDINNPESIEFYLNLDNFDGSLEEAVHSAAGEKGDIDTDYLKTVSETSHTYSLLPEMWRDLIDGYINTQMCAPTLAQYKVSGYEDVNLYELCSTLLDERLALLQPNLFQRSSYLRGIRSIGVEPINSLRNRLDSLEGQLQAPRTHDGYRPRLTR